MNPFDYVNAINKGKDIMSNTDNDELAEKGYNAFMTNKSFSYFRDTIIVANEMNIRHFLDNRLQYSFFINTIRPKRRWSRWSKPEHHADLEAIVEYFGYSYEKAKQVVDILSDDEIKSIKRKITKGGLKK
jgi:hypothetical protein